MPSTPSKVYGSKQAAGKALMRLRVRLPFSPRKRKAITLKLAIESGNDSFIVADRYRNDTVPQEVVDKVTAFYGRDDISWAAPGMKDAVKVACGKKIVLQKRFMTMNIMEAHHLFKEENPDVHVGKSKFFEFRPKHVKVMAEIPHNVCICKIHGDMDSLLQGIGKQKPQTPRSGRVLLETIVCARENADCMLNTCNKCSNAEFKVDLNDTNDDEEDATVNWRKWEDVGGRPVQVDVSMSIKDAAAQVNALLTDYKTHAFIKDQQSSWFKTCKNEIPVGRAVVQVDFAENYAAVSQDEVQSAHWNHKQITVFTAVAWLSDTCKSFAIISDDLNHDKFAVWFMLKMIIKSLVEEFGTNNIMIFSDGCAAQFKNRYTMMNLCYMMEDFGVTGEWAFSASSHGKGSVDAVGGTVKRNVWKVVKARKVIVSDAKTFYKVTWN